MTVDVRPSETECERTIVEAARMLGYLVHGSRPATSQKGWRTPLKGDRGFPDLVICGHGHCFMVELKRKPNRIEPAQQAWFDVLTAAGIDVRVVWVPEQQQQFIDTLAEHTRPAAVSRR
ncbi:hypothetical protein BH24ACT5_BH24ACT5_30640 [soil metagenome]